MTSYFQAYNPTLGLAMKVNRAKVRQRPPATEAEKAHRKELARIREERIREENLAQRALIESRRA